jgi:hypothetical protein
MPSPSSSPAPSWEHSPSSGGEESQ